MNCDLISNHIYKVLEWCCSLDLVDISYLDLAQKGPKQGPFIYPYRLYIDLAMYNVVGVVGEVVVEVLVEALV